MRAGTVRVEAAEATGLRVSAPEPSKVSPSSGPRVELAVSAGEPSVVRLGTSVEAA